MLNIAIKKRAPSGAHYEGGVIKTEILFQMFQKLLY